MREPNRPEEVAVSNQRSLSTLSRAITLSSGNFALILVRCNYEICSQQMWERLKELTGVPLSELVLQKSSKTLFAAILGALTGEQTSALVVFGLESVIALDQVLISTNQVRDEFRKSFTYPLVLWITDEVLQKLTRFAPDFKSWAATSIKFELATDQLLALWHQTTAELFTTILGSDFGEFLPNNVLDLTPSCRRRQELESALRDLYSRGITVEPGIVATWRFIRGRDAFSYDQIDVALQLYQQSLDFWQQKLGARDWGLGTREEVDTGTSAQEDTKIFSKLSTSSIPASPQSLASSPYLERVGVLLHHIGLCYCRQAQLQQLTSHRKWEQARESFNAGIEVFKSAGRLDLVAQLTIQLGEVLQHLQSWTELQTLALESLEQPQIQNNPVQLAQAFGFLAAVAYGRFGWEDTRDFALTALDILEQSQSPPLLHRACYLLLLAKAHRRLGKPDSAIADLEQAIKLSNALQKQPQLYIEILEELRSLYFEQQQYLRAFELRQEQRLILQQYGFCPFLGTTPLQPFTRQGRGVLPLEIAAAGRQPDIKRLIERLSRNDHKLTIIHGSSGVGKSSLINAGLIPALEGRIIGARETIPVVQRVYRNWIGELERCLTQVLTSWHARLDNSNEDSEQNLEWQTEQSSSSPNPKLQSILEQLRLSSERNLLTVIIFDQFEEFFFVCTTLAERRQFYEFLGQCLNLPFVKIIFSLREDYLHYLLECERCGNLNVINNNILDRQLRYHLGDLLPEDAKNVINTLVGRSQVQLEESLIEALVQDLSRTSGRVRLIELQLVGAQLQTEKVTTLKQYYALGNNPKASLVERLLLNVISDCGKDNEDIVWQVLFSLTDDKGTRPLKTQLELVKDELKVGKLKVKPLDLLTSNLHPSLQQEKLDLILKILVGSGLVFRVPEEPQDRYQLIHDYLVEPIRQNYKQRAQLNIVAQLEKSEIELSLVRRQRVRAIALGVTMAVLALTAASLGWRAEIQRQLTTALSINAQLSAMSVSSEALFLSNKKFDALIQGLRAARRLKQVETFQFSSIRVEPDTRLQVVTALSQAVYETLERNRLDGHNDVVWSVSFSPDGQLIASASRDKTVKLWRPNGMLAATLNGHTNSVTSVSFSPDSQLIASGSWDGTVRLWHRNGTLVRTLRGQVGQVYTVSFSPNGQFIALGGSNGAIELWSIGGRLVQTFRGHKGIVRSVSFSPTGEMMASTGADKTIKLWTPAGKLLRTLNGHGAKVNCVVFSPDGQLLASASDDQTVKLWNLGGKLLKTFPKQGSWVFSVAFSSNGQLIASASGDKTVRLWHRNGTLLETFTGHSDNVTAVSFNPVAHVKDSMLALRSQEKAADNGHLTTDKPLLASASYDKTIKLWQPRNQSPLVLRGHQGEVRDVTFSPDSKLIVTAGSDRTVKIWSRAGKLLHILRGHTKRIYAVSFSPNGQLIASASQDGTVRLWTRRGTLLKTLRGDCDWILNVSFSPDSQRLLGACRNGMIKLWTHQGTLLKTLSGHRNSLAFPSMKSLPSGNTSEGERSASRVNAVSFSPDGQRIASASDDNTVKLWTADGTLLKTLTGHSSWVLDVSFSPDSQMLASASYDNTVKLWSRDGELIRTLKGHTDSVAHVRFSPTGEFLATTSWDNRVQLWRLDDTLIKALEAPKERVTSISWSHDGKALAGANKDGTVMVWNLDLDDLLNKSCSWLRDYLHNNSKVRQIDRDLCKPTELQKRADN